MCLIFNDDINPQYYFFINNEDMKKGKELLEFINKSK